MILHRKAYWSICTNNAIDNQLQNCNLFSYSVPYSNKYHVSGSQSVLRTWPTSKSTALANKSGTKRVKTYCANVEQSNNTNASFSLPSDLDFESSLDLFAPIASAYLFSTSAHAFYSASAYGRACHDASIRFSLSSG